jgi:hypothetical protein
MVVIDNCNFCYEIIIKNGILDVLKGVERLAEFSVAFDPKVLQFGQHILSHGDSQRVEDCVVVSHVEIEPEFGGLEGLHEVVLDEQEEGVDCCELQDHEVGQSEIVRLELPLLALHRFFRNDLLLHRRHAALPVIPPLLGLRLEKDLHVRVVRPRVFQNLILEDEFPRVRFSPIAACAAGVVPFTSGSFFVVLFDVSELLTKLRD